MFENQRGSFPLSSALHLFENCLLLCFSLLEQFSSFFCYQPDHSQYYNQPGYKLTCTEIQSGALGLAFWLSLSPSLSFASVPFVIKTQTHTLSHSLRTKITISLSCSNRHTLSLPLMSFEALYLFSYPLPIFPHPRACNRAPSIATYFSLSLSPKYLYTSVNLPIFHIALCSL